MLAELGHREFKPGVGAVVSFLLFVLLGALLVSYPAFTSALLGGLCFVGAVLLTLRCVRLQVWQVLLLTSVTGYIILNYGFENIAFRVGGVPILIGYMLAYTAFGLAIRSSRGLVGKALREPAMVCLLALLLPTLIHLAFELPRYGLYAVHDASIALDGIFLLLGLLWALDGRNTASLMKWLLFIFLANLIYGYSFPWADRLVAWSPISGAFQPVSVLGHYNMTARYFVLGALFCLWLGRYVVRWPRWIMFVLAAAQLFGLAIHQVRSTYIDIAFVLILLMFLGEARKWAGLVTTLSLGLAALLFLAPTLARVRGRIGPVTLASIEEQAESGMTLFGKAKPHDPLEGDIYERQVWWRQIWTRLKSNQTKLLVGEGFGQALTDFRVYSRYGVEVTVRTPHNSNMAVLARLGALGLGIWILFHLCILRRFLFVFRRRSCLDKRSSDLVLWLLIFYVASMTHAFVQGELEYPSGAITFYFMMGFTIGFLRWQVQGSASARGGSTYSGRPAR